MAKKTQSEATLEIETLGNKSGTIDASISNRIQGMEERISGAEDSIENIDTTVKENTKCKRILFKKKKSLSVNLELTNSACWLVTKSQASVSGPSLELELRAHTISPSFMWLRI